MSEIVHKRYVAGTSAFIEFIEELGYKFVKKVFINHKPKFTYIKEGKPDKYIDVSLEGLSLYVLVKDKKVQFHQGLTVHDEIVKFFTNRNPIKQ